MQFAFRERPDHPRFRRTKFELAFMCLFANLRILLKHPFELGRREIAIEQEPCFLAESVRVYARSECPTNGCPSRVLPNDGGSHRIARILIPNNKGLTLVIEPDRSDVICTVQQGRTSLFHCSNNIPGILFD